MLLRVPATDPCCQVKYMAYTRPLLYFVLSMSTTATTSYNVAMREPIVAGGLLLVVVAVAVIVTRLPNISCMKLRTPMISSLTGSSSYHGSLLSNLGRISCSAQCLETKPAYAHRH